MGNNTRLHARLRRKSDHRGMLPWDIALARVAAPSGNAPPAARSLGKHPKTQVEQCRVHRLILLRTPPYFAAYTPLFCRVHPLILYYVRERLPCLLLLTCRCCSAAFHDDHSWSPAQPLAAAHWARPYSPNRQRRVRRSPLLALCVPHTTGPQMHWRRHPAGPDHTAKPGTTASHASLSAFTHSWYTFILRTDSDAQTVFAAPEREAKGSLHNGGQ